MHVRMYVLLDGWIHGWMDVCVFVCVYVCMYVCVCRSIRALCTLTSDAVTHASSSQAPNKCSRIFKVSCFPNLCYYLNSLFGLMHVDGVDDYHH